METQSTWYATKAGNALQGLVIDEKTGRNVAVSYDAADTPVLAAAPAMLAALIEAEQFVSDRQDPEDEGEDWLLGVLRAAIAQARGE